MRSKDLIDFAAEVSKNTGTEFVITPSFSGSGWSLHLKGKNQKIARTIYSNMAVCQLSMYLEAYQAGYDYAKSQLIAT